MPRRSCLINLIRVAELLVGMTDQGEPVGVVYLDVTKAFDSMCQGDESNGNPYQNNPLGGRVSKGKKHFKSKIGRDLSREGIVKSGVPQL